MFNVDPACTISGNEDAANNWARGCYCTPEKFVMQVDDGLRAWAERVDVIQGIMALHSICGGTGGGFASM